MFKRSNNLALPHQSGRNCEKNKVKTEILEVNGSTRQPMKKVCVYTGGSDPYGERMGGYGSQGSGLLVLYVVLVLDVCADVSVYDVTEEEKHQSE